MATVGDRVKQRRTELGLTQDALAEKAGISKSFLSDLENGRRSIGAETLLDLGRAMGVSLDFLMVGGESSVQHDDPQIPASLALLAEKEGLSVRQALTLLRIREHIAESRRSPKKANEVDWRELYLAVKKFL
jgi:transcriptional regulator with XRE-family HTH domain